MHESAIKKFAAKGNVKLEANTYAQSALLSVVRKKIANLSLDALKFNEKKSGIHMSWMKKIV
jgi:hypothetical protein